MKGNLFTIIYATCMGIVCATLLTTVGVFTKPYREANKEAEKIRNILAVLNVPLEGEPTPERLIEIFKANVDEQQEDGQTIYVYSSKSAEVGDGFAVEFSGKGLWGPIKGFLSLEADMRTIRGVSFSEQEETPGLGGEIASDWFRKQFVGKSIVDESGKAGILIGRVAKDKVNGVDGITGATMTCDMVQNMLNRTIVKIVKEQE